MISIKDWNNLPDNKKKEAIEFLHSEIQNSELFKLLCGKYISSTAKLNAWQRIVLQNTYKDKQGNFYCQIGKYL